MSNSSLVAYTKISPNKTSPRKFAIDTIIIHCVVGQCSVETLGDIFAPTSREASSNYGVGVDGRIGMYVEEKDRSWCSGGYTTVVNGVKTPIRVNGYSGADYDHRAVTIEVASDTTHPYAVKDVVYQSLIKLVADICKRNNIKKLLWSGDKTLVGNVAKQNMAVHRWFANKACPGDYLYERMGDIATKANALLGETTTTPTTTMYRVRKTWGDSATQKGAFTKLDNAKACADENKAAGYKVFDDKGTVVYTPITSPSAEEVTVDNAIKDGFITDRTHWLGVLTGTIVANKGNIKTLMDNAHNIINK